MVFLDIVHLIKILRFQFLRMMQRGKSKTAPIIQDVKSKTPKEIQSESQQELKASTNTSQDSISNPSNSLPDLSKFKFEKKPHVKIEFDKDSQTKEDSKGLWEPPNWRDFLLNLKIMRSNNDAPVDSMGCHMSMDENAPPQVYRYQCLISLMLSSQTKDQVTFAAMERLRARGLTIDNVLMMSDEDLGQLIYPVGFWKTKVKYIKKTTQTLKEQYNGDIPDSVDKLCKLTGVGPKMAHICMKVAWNKITGIGVDTHVHRISNRIGWVRKTTNTPEDTRKALQSWLPFELWSEVNHLMVGFGQTICLPINPTCHECLNRDICPSSGKHNKSPKKSPMKKEIDINMYDGDFEQPKNKKVVPKHLKYDEQNNIMIKLENECIDKKSPRKRKTTPKKNVCDSEIEDFKETNQKLPLNAKSLQVIDVCEKAPQKRKVTPTKNDRSQGNTKDSDSDDFNLKNVQADLKQNKDATDKLLLNRKRSPKKKLNTEGKQTLLNKNSNKKNTKTDALLQINNIDADIKEYEVKPLRNTRSKTQDLNIVVESVNKKSPIKRKPPRNKQIQVISEDGTNDSAAKKKSKVVKST